MKLLRIVTVVVFLLTAAAACSSDDDNDRAVRPQTSPSPDQEPTPTLSATPTAKEPRCNLRTLAADGNNQKLRTLRAKCLQQRDGRNARQALFAAAGAAQTDTIRMLLKWRVDPNLRDSRGLTPAFYAATVAEHAGSEQEPQRLATVRALIENGTQLEATSDAGDTILHIAAGSGLSSIVSYLLEQGANPDSRNASGATPADVAAASGHPRTARLLAG